MDSTLAPALNQMDSAIANFDDITCERRLRARASVCVCVCVRRECPSPAANMTSFNITGRMATLDLLDSSIQHYLSLVDISVIVVSAGRVDTAIASAYLRNAAGLVQNWRGAQVPLVRSTKQLCCSAISAQRSGSPASIWRLSKNCAISSLMSGPRWCPILALLHTGSLSTMRLAIVHRTSWCVRIMRIAHRARAMSARFIACTSPCSVRSLDALAILRWCAETRKPRARACALVTWTRLCGLL